MDNKITIEIDPSVLHDLHFGLEYVLCTRKKYYERITEAVNPRDASDSEIEIEKKKIEVVSNTLNTIQKAYNEYCNKEK